MDERRPLISCLMVTRGALVPARFAIAGFLGQSYAPRELVVVCDAPAPALAAHVAALADPRIRLVETPAAPLGGLREVAVAAARGPLVAQWDDDDLYAPTRLAEQQAALAASPHAAILLRRWTMWWPERGWLAPAQARGWEGSLLGWKARLAPYPPMARGEDSAMIAAMLAAGESIGLIDRPDLYCYVVHGRNSFDTAHFETLFAHGGARLDAGAYAHAMASRDPFPFADYAGGLASRS